MEHLIIKAKELYLIALRNNTLDQLSSCFKKYVDFYDAYRKLFKVDRISNKEYVSITNVVFMISTERTELLTHKDDILILNQIIN